MLTLFKSENTAQDQYNAKQKSAELAPKHSISRKDPIGKGSFSVVYAGEYAVGSNPVTHEQVAIKVMKNFVAAEHEIQINMHIRDAHALTNTKEQFSVGYKGHHQTDDEMILLFALMPCDLVQFVEKLYDDAAIRSYALDILLAVDFMHNVAGIIIADLHAKNVLVDDNKAKLADFGLSIFNCDRLEIYKRGTPLFFAPELLAERFSHNDSCSDIWALGLTYYYLVTRSEPFKDLNHLDNDAFAKTVIARTAPISFKDDDLARQPLLTRLSLLACHPNAAKRPTAEALVKTAHQAPRDAISLLR